ncbi:tetratricopeptide repeat protein [Actinomadura pelletieri]|uniref:tetratricopeptide repeat protein n=1 Tax=Actinomadura pelletieri TaxID=111805 RepID=UPI0011C4AB3C|nr:tetratricopeptide repeat protein [Actinomadura pelletieri]
MADSVVFGSVNQIAGVQGDVRIEAERPLYRLEALPAAGPVVPVEDARRRPGLLLQAGLQQVPFAGRDEQLDRLETWREDRSGAPVLLVHGPGGQGKSRLAAQFGAKSLEVGWRVLVARHADDPAALAAADTHQAEEPRREAGALLLVDYAERWPVTDLLALLADAAGQGARVLLLARPAGPWWSTLAFNIAKFTATAAPVRLPPLGDQIDREQLFTDARDAFARALQVSPDSVQPPVDLETQPGFGLVLAVHMAALAAVDAASREVVAPQDLAAVSGYLLARERDHWRWLHRNADVAVDVGAMGQAVYLAVLTGSQTYDDGLLAVRAAQIGTSVHPDRILKDHAVAYPPHASDSVLEPLYPDRLGEDLLALSTPGHHSDSDYPADPWASQAAARIITATTTDDGGARDAGSQKDGPVWARPALTTLVQAAARWPHIATTQLAPLLTEHPHLALSAGGATLAALADIDTLDITVLETIEAVLPEDSHVELNAGIAAVTQRLATHRLTTTDPAQRARIHDNLAVRLSHAGQRNHALTEGQQALHTWRHLAATNPTAYLSNLAASLNNHALRLAEVGRRDEALPVSQEAVELRRELAAANRAAFLPDLATSLNNHANRLAEVGRRDEALLVSQEAVELRRELAAANRAAFLPDLATSLNNHAALLAEVGRRDGALLVSQEAVELRRELAAANRAAFLPDLATSLNNHAALLAEVGRRDGALPVSREAVELRRELAVANRAAFLPDLAMSLSNHAVRLAEVGRRDEALLVSQEAVELRRELAVANRAAFLPDLAMSLSNHAVRLAEVGRRDEALLVSQEAVELRRELAVANRAAFLPDLAMSLNNHALRLAEVGRRDEALPVSQEAVELRRELVATNPAAYLPAHTRSITVLGHVLVLDARFGEAVAPLVEALVAAEKLPEYDQGIVVVVIDLLRRCHAGDAAGVDEVFRAVTGQDVPEWMKQPPDPDEL